MKLLSNQISVPILFSSPLFFPLLLFRYHICTRHQYFPKLFHTPWLYYTILYCTVLYCTVLYCTILYYTILYSTVRCSSLSSTSLHHFFPFNFLSLSFSFALDSTTQFYYTSLLSFLTWFWEGLRTHRTHCFTRLDHRAGKS